jgi:hypothetical protein
MITSRRSSLRPVSFLAVAVLVLTGVILSRSLRILRIPEGFQYVPAEAFAVLCIGEIRSVWRAAELHLDSATSGVADGGLPLGPVSAALRDLASTLEEEGVPVGGLEDLESYGVDVNRGILVAFSGPMEAPDVIAMVPARDAPTLTEWLTKLVGGPAHRKVCAVGSEPIEALWLQSPEDEAGETGIFLVEHPREVLLASSCEALWRSLGRIHTNLDYARRNDSLDRFIREQLEFPPLSGPALFFYGASRFATELRDLGLVLRLEPDRIEFRAALPLGPQPLQPVEDLLESPPSEAPWRSWVAGESLATAAVLDHSLAKYLEFLAEIGPFGEGMQEFYGGIFDQLRRMPELDQLAFALTSYYDGTPRVVVGVRTSRHSARELVTVLQERLHTSRDLEILNAALSAHHEGEGRNLDGEITLAELPVEPEPGAFLDRYDLRNLGGPLPRFNASDFDDESYRHDHDGVPVWFLAPPVTNNDLTYRLASDDRENLDDREVETLLSDRFRLAAAQIGEFLWLAPGAEELHRLIHRSEQVRERGGSGEIASLWAHTRPKVELRLHLHRMFTEAMASPDATTPDPDGTLSDQILYALLDVRDHELMWLRLEVRPLKRTISLLASVEREAVEAGP